MLLNQVLARILAELVLGLALQNVERAFHVLRRERLAVVPFDALMQLECQRRLSLLTLQLSASSETIVPIEFWGLC